MRILVIAAHPDDIEFGAAGSVARWIDEGAQVAYVIVTDGAAGSNDPNAERAALVERRRAEQVAAAAAVGVHEVHFLNYPDGMLTPSLDLRRDLTRLIRRFKPTRVLTFDPTVYFYEEVGYINHPDHRATGEAAVYAVFPSAETRPIFPELLDEGLEPHKVDELYLFLPARPTLYVDISTTHERKAAALLCHASQVQPEVVQWLQKMDGDMAKLGALPVPYAEAFRVVRQTPVQGEQQPAPQDTGAPQDAAPVEQAVAAGQ